jgi:hypothetical protein
MLISLKNSSAGNSSASTIPTVTRMESALAPASRTMVARSP